PTRRYRRSLFPRLQPLKPVGRFKWCSELADPPRSPFRKGSVVERCCDPSDAILDSILAEPRKIAKAGRIVGLNPPHVCRRGLFVRRPPLPCRCDPLLHFVTYFARLAC